MMYNWQTGLMSVEILPESKGTEGAIVRYIARTKGWNRGQYWIERRGASKDGHSEVFAVIRLCDRCLAVCQPSPISRRATKGISCSPADILVSRTVAIVGAGH
jgi:hypothetical protein